MAAQLAWLTLKTRAFPKWFDWLMLLPGIISFPFPPAGFVYLQLAVLLRRQAAPAENLSSEL